jgi:DNA repair protein RAD51
MRIITTGSSSIDKMLGGGIRTGLITNILSDSRDARSSMCYSLCVNAAQGYKNSSIIFGDTQGFYRPEKILSYIKDKPNSSPILHQIRSLRILSLNVQMVLVNYALNLRPILIIIDNFSYLFLNERKKLLSVQIFLRKHLHDLAISAIDNDIAIVLTNPIFTKKENIDSGDIFEKKNLPYNELLNKIISNHVHVVLELKTVKVNESRFSARALKPISGDKSYLIARQDGLYDC